MKMYEDIPQVVLELGVALEKAITAHAEATMQLYKVLNEITKRSDDKLLGIKFIYQVIVRDYLVSHEIISIKDGDELLKKIDETIENCVAKRIKPLPKN